jgi:adenylate kinase
MLIEEFGFTHLAPGDLLRKEIQEETPLGLQAEGVMRAGRLVSDEIIHGMIGKQVAAVLERQGRILFDGFPRTVGQLEFLESFLARYGSRLPAVFFLDIPQERLIERLTGRRICTRCNAVYHIQTLPPSVEGVCDACGGPLIQRKDDNRESIQGRLRAYEEQTYPVRQAFETQGKLVRVDGDQPREAVYEAIAREVRRLLEETALADQA